MTEVAVSNNFLLYFLFENVNNAEGMHRDIWASFLHSISSNDNPQHQNCPTGITSWCFFNQAEAVGAPFPDHSTTTISTMLSPEVGAKLIPIYERMTDPNLLTRMTTGSTQNANESFNNLLWVFCPKSVFVSSAKVRAAVEMATSRFNAGAQSLKDRMSFLGVEPNQAQLACMAKQDELRVKNACKAANETVKEIRKIRSDAQRQALLDLEAVEGVQYGAGEF